MSSPFIHGMLTDSHSGEQGHDAFILKALELLKDHAPHLLRNQELMQTLEMENADLKKTIKQLKYDNDQLRKAKMELERKLGARKSAEDSQ